MDALALESDPVTVVAVMRLMEDLEEWIGTTGELWQRLSRLTDDEIRRHRSWPKQPNHLS